MAKELSNQVTMQLYFEGKCEWGAPLSFDHFCALCDLLCHQDLDEKIVIGALDLDDRIAKQSLLTWLRAELKTLRHEEKKPGSAPARRRRTLPRKHIADVAIFLLNQLMDSPDNKIAKSNRDNLICLLEELLDVDRHRAAFANQAQYTQEFEQATTNDAAAALKGETIAVNKLARKVGVSPATIIAWRKSQNYKVRMEWFRNRGIERAQEGNHRKHDAAGPDRSSASGAK